jgi:hypothetical protein
MRGYSEGLVAGFQHIPYQKYLWADVSLMDRVRATLMGIHPVLSKAEETGYWNGRIFRFVVNIPGSVIDIALQIINGVGILQVICLSAIEMKLTGCEPEEAKCKYCLLPFALLEEFRQATVARSLDLIAQDLGLFFDENEEITLKNSKFDFLGPQLADDIEQ